MHASTIPAYIHTYYIYIQGFVYGDIRYTYNRIAFTIIRTTLFCRNRIPERWNSAVLRCGPGMVPLGFGLPYFVFTFFLKEPLWNKSVYILFSPWLLKIPGHLHECQAMQNFFSYPTEGCLCSRHRRVLQGFYKDYQRGIGHSWFLVKGLRFKGVGTRRLRQRRSRGKSTHAFLKALGIDSALSSARQSGNI